MPRIPKTTEYTADDETILAHFDESLELAEEQKASRAELATHNKRMYADGVDSGTLSVCRKLALMKPGKRGIAVALLHRYLEVLASRLEDPAMARPGEAPAKVRSVPFERQRPSAA